MRKRARSFGPARAPSRITFSATGRPGGFNLPSVRHARTMPGKGDAMRYIDPHIHMISRTTDDYQRMAYAQCAAVSEPAFWAGFDRGTAAGFHDYFRHLTEVEPKRAAQFHIKHYSWLCI